MQGMKLRQRILPRCIGTGLLILVLLAVSLISQTTNAATSDPSLVKTQQGVVQGVVQSAFRAFLGIPYAAPPVGNLRWKPPQMHAPWSTPLNATRAGSPCAQGASPFGQASTNEDCLFLNVYTPNPVTTNAPVMVWIHGGAFVTGEGSDYDPSTTLVARGTVVVTINYRLGAFGFLALPSLSAEDTNGSSGNYGLQDQQFALQWVHSNILAFGGNPNNVTIFGESAGGFSVCANIASPDAHGLFQRAITESGPCTFPLPTLASVESTDTTLATKLGCAQQVATQQTACLRALTTQQILAAQSTGLNVGSSSGSILLFSPNVDGSVLPQSLTNALLSGRFNHVPVLEGTNQTEGRLFIAVGFDLTASGPLTAAQYPAAVQALVGTQAAPQVLEEYPLSKFSSPDVALSAIFGDAGFSCPALSADQLFVTSVPTFAYEFNDTNAPMIFLPPVSFPYGATHTDELQYLFQIDALASRLNTNQQQLSQQMINYWVQFAKNGDPNSSQTTNWAAYNAFVQNFQSLVPPAPALELGFAQEHHCVFWAQVVIEGILSGMITA
ncbi:MAG TPA: carboxylesterase family protein [Ktedonobacteraceae bacterium]|nr:carboxylesterase family protein [Ktedonobacteraceae bacterium]